ncbi:MAG: hypothetical protein L0215_21825 [Gemmataceae bacterium]|nr:hypothetical protein [Gemmataceae bacterium]
MFSATLLAWAVLGSGDLPSGPNPGDKLQEFKAHGIFGDNEGKEFEVLKSTKDRPILLIFVHKITRPALQLLKPVDEYAAKEEKLAAHVIWLGEKEKAEEFLKRAKNSLNLQLPVSIAADKEGPPAYGLNDQVTMTIVLAKDKKVTNNFAFVDPNATVAPKVIAAVAKLLGKEPPKAKEEEKKRNADGKSPELQKLMRRMIQKDNDEATVDRVVQAMKKWAGDDDAKRKELREHAQLVVRLGYGNEIAQAALKKLAESKD